MNGYHVHAPLRLIESACLVIAAIAVIVFCLLGWLIFPLMMLTPWRTLGEVGLTIWLLWVVIIVGYELSTWMRSLIRGDRSC